MEVAIVALALAAILYARNASAASTTSNATGGDEVSYFQLTGPGAQYRDIIEGNAAAYSLDPYLVAAVCQHESSWNPRAVNASAVERSIGLMQINVHAHPEFDESDMLDPAQNIAAGCQVLAGSIQNAMAKGVDAQDVTRIGVAGYNMGAAVSKYLRGIQDPDPSYTSSVANAYQAMTGSRPW